MPDIESLPRNPNEWPRATLTGVDLKPKLTAVDQAIAEHARSKYPHIKNEDESLYICGDAEQKLALLAVELGILTPTILVPKALRSNPYKEDKRPEEHRFGMELRFPTGLEAAYEVMSTSTWQGEPYQELQRLAVTANRQSAGEMAMFAYQVFAHDNYAGDNPSYGGLVFAPLHEVVTLIGKGEEGIHHETVAMGYGESLPKIGDWALLGLHLPMMLLPPEMLQSRFMNHALRRYALSEGSPIIDRQHMPSWEQFLEKHQESLIPETYRDLIWRINYHKKALADFDYS